MAINCKSEQLTVPTLNRSHQAVRPRISKQDIDKSAAILDCNSVSTKVDEWQPRGKVIRTKGIRLRDLNMQTLKTATNSRQILILKRPKEVDHSQILLETEVTLIKKEHCQLTRLEVQAVQSSS